MTDETKHVTVHRRDDGLWLHFGPYAAVHISKVLTGKHGSIIDRNIRLFCEQVAVDD